MLFPIIKIKSRGGNRSHIVGMNSHDVLYVDDDGSLQYLNAQCMAGTKYGEFVFDVEMPSEYTLTGRPEIKFVDFDTLLSMMTDHLNEGMKAKIDTYKALRQYWDKELERTYQETGIRSTDGNLP